MNTKSNYIYYVREYKTFSLKIKEVSKIVEFLCSAYTQNGVGWIGFFDYPFTLFFIQNERNQHNV